MENNFVDFLDKKKFTDVELILTDGINKHSIHAHKIILSCYCAYFYKLFHFNDEPMYTINIPYINALIQIIDSFYGKEIKCETSKELLQIYMTKNYLTFNIDPRPLYNLKVDEEDFDLLLEVCNLFDIENDYRLLCTIRNNAPRQYIMDDHFTPLIKKTLEITKNNVYENLKNYGLDVQMFISKLKEHGCVISGSFMYKSLMNDKDMVFNDIDVIVYDPDFPSRDYNSLNPQNTYAHPFEIYIKDISKGYYTKNSYVLINGVFYSKIYKTDNIDINVIITNKPVRQFVNEDFDLDCCKIIFDGDNICVYNIDDLLQRKSLARVNDYDANKLYQNRNTTIIPNNNRSILDDYVSIANSLAFIKLRMMHDVYLYAHGKISIFPTYTHHKHFCNINNNSYNTASHVNVVMSVEQHYQKYLGYIQEISKRIDLDRLFSYPTNYHGISLNSDHLKVMAMIRLLERMDKYRSRGMEEFIFVN